MEYKSEFETRKDVFKVNVFHNKKNGEKVTMYFVPRTTPVNDDTLFDYCTKNKTWREKQAQQWCDEKSGKNKDKLKSLPFVAGGLQRDLKWFGDKAMPLFDDYKKGLGVPTKAELEQQRIELEQQKIEVPKKAEEKRLQELQENLKYLKVLSERPDVEIKQLGGEGVPLFSAFIETPYGPESMVNDIVQQTMGNMVRVGYYSKTDLEAMKAVDVSAEEREKYNQKIEESKKELIIQRGRAEAQRLSGDAKKRLQIVRGFLKLKAEGKITVADEIELIPFSVTEKTENNPDHRSYVLQDDKGTSYKLNVDYGNNKVVDKEQNIEKPMRTLTIAYEKVGGNEDEKFALSSAVEPEIFAKNPLSIDLVFAGNLKTTISTKADKRQALLLKKLLKESEDPITDLIFAKNFTVSRELAERYKMPRKDKDQLSLQRRLLEASERD